MVNLSDNAFSVKLPLKSLVCHFQMSLLLALDSSVPFELSSSKFRSNFELPFSNFWYFETHFLLYSLSLNTDMDCIPFISVYITSILLILATNM